MPITVHPTAYGPDAAEELARIVASAKAADALAPVTVVVPTNYAGVSARRSLAARQGLVAVTFVTIYRLAELLGGASLAADGRRPVSTPVLGAAVRQVLKRAPGRFAPVRDHPATVEALLRAHRELRDLDAAQLDVLAAASGRAAEVVRVHRAVTEGLAPAWHDERDLVDAATGVVAGGTPLTDQLGTVVVHLPQALSAAAGRLVAALGTRADVHLVVGLTGVETADIPVVRLQGRVGHEARLALSPPAASGAPVTVVTATDPEDEVRAAVRHVLQAARNGTPLGRMAICYGSAEPYCRLVGEQLDAAGIARNGSATVALRERLAARTLLAFLALRDRGVQRHDVFAVLSSAPVRVASGTLAPVARWERLSRDAGVVAGPEQWTVRLGALGTSLEDRADDADDDDGGPSGDRLRGDAAAALDLAAFVAELTDRVPAGADVGTWRGFADLGHHLVDRYLGGDAVRATWPVPERQAADRVCAALDRLGGLDEVDPAPTLDDFRHALELELDADLGRVGRLGEGVFTGPLALAVGLELDVVVVVGLVEGSLPARPTDDPLLPDRVRSAVDGALALSRDRIADQHRQFLAALAAARVGIVLCAPRGDLRRSTRRVPSRWLADVQAASTTEIASFAAGVAGAEFPATAQEHNLRALLGGGGVLVTDEPAFRDGRRLIRARRSAALTAYDGNVAGAGVPSPFTEGAVVSPTRLESWARCPLAYFMRYVLGVEPVENPEDLLEMTPIDRGNLVHATLERFVAGVLADGAPAPDEPWTAAHEEALLHAFAVETARAHRKGLTGRDLFWRRDRRVLERDLRAWLVEDAEVRRASRERPVAAELRFGTRGATGPAVPIVLDGGDTISMRGSADRLDRSETGALRIVDYKTGSSRSYKGLSPAEPTGGGVRLQLPVYALAARAAVGEPDARTLAEYWFVSGRERFNRIGFLVTDDVLAAFRQDLATIATGIAEGRFPAHPDVPVWQRWVSCPYCDPDGLGTGERWREWERKQGAAELAPYLGLVARQR